MNRSSNHDQSSDNVTQGQAGVNASESAGPKPAFGRGKLVKAAGVVSLWTFLSRILGMVRDVVSARQFGTSWQWDAFVYAFMLPNFFRRLVGEGALSGAFIPVYTETLQQKGKADAFHFANVILTVWAVGLAVFLLAAEAGLTWLVESGHFGDRLLLTFQLLRILFPYLFLISLFAIVTGVLHSHRRFFSPALSPVILNVVWIAGILWVAPRAGSLPAQQLHGLAWCLLGAGGIQLAVQIPALRREGFRFCWVFDWASEGLKKTFRLLFPALMGFAVMQINILVDMSLAFLVGPGANSSLWYGTRLMQFPLGVFAIAMGTALLPAISRHVAKKNSDAANQSLSFAIRNVFLIILPCSVGLIVLSTPIVQLLFERGEFNAASTARTSLVLVCYALGLFAYSGQKMFTTGFHARQDTRTPVKIGIIALLTNVVLNLILMGPMKEAGLALATSIAGALQFGLLAYFFDRKTKGFPFPEVMKSFTKILLASLGMGAVGWILLNAFNPLRTGILQSSAFLAAEIAVGLAVYLLLCYLFKVHELREAWQWIRQRKIKGAAQP
ncbi:murein biosynthesis integral membrane protein MurJ [Omnitrophica bacterium]|nr:murein biosynthesis integral membrane protein MurJ [Candidatus Omnitrophota bacterium]